MEEKLNDIANSNNIKVIDYLQNKKLLHNGRYCPQCHMDGIKIRMKLSARSDVCDGYGWRCSRCGKRISLRKDTFFENFKLSLLVLLRIVLHWAIQTRQCDIAELSDCHRNSVLTFEQRLRKVASRASNQCKTVLGGVGRIVEIDESLYIKRT
jgi:transposase-like protein